MENQALRLSYANDAFFFKDTLIAAKPFCAIKPRTHESLCIVTDGILAYERSGKTVLIEKGQIAYIPRGAIDKSGAYKCSAVSYSAVNFSFDIENPMPKPTLPFETLCCKNSSYKLEELFEAAISEYKSGRPGSQMICNGILQQIIGMLCNNFNISRVDTKKAQMLEPALEYLNRNYHSPELKISELARLSNISEKHFRRLFFELYDKTPHKYLRDFRLSKARVLLMDSSRQISDIAIECGFSDVYSFSHCFKGCYGMSPRAYKEQMK